MGKQIAPTATNYERQLTDILESFTKGQDMGTATWGVHARSIVDYNPATKMITYHDPYYGGVDLEISLDEFKKLSPQISVIKAPQSTAVSSPTVSSPARTSSPPEPKKRYSIGAETPQTTALQDVQPKVTTSSLKAPPGFYPCKTKVNGMRTIINPSTNVKMVETNGKWQMVL